MKIARKIFISLGIAFFAVCCGAVLLFDWSVTGWKAYTVPTSSMRPTMPPGSLVLVHSVPAKSLKAGDVITYNNLLKPGSTITHRIIKAYTINGKIPAFITKGDANPTADQPVVAGQVRGKATWHAPYVGTLLMWGKGIVGLIILVYIPAIFIMFEETRRLGDYYRRMRPYVLTKFERETVPKLAGKVAGSALLGLVITLAIVGVGSSVQALLRSNTVSLAPNSLKVARITPPPAQCTGNITNINLFGNGGGNILNNVNVFNGNNQFANTGNASSSGNTNSGNVTTGNATNNNNTCTSITIINH